MSLRINVQRGFGIILIMLLHGAGFGQNTMRVADMHYHISMKAYNKFGVSLRDSLKRNKPIKSNYLTAITDTETGINKKLKRKYGIVRPVDTNSDLSNYTQASIPQTFQGHVQLAFNAISPFEHSLAVSFWDRFFNKYFKSKADLNWLKIIGDWNQLTHFENFNYEYKFVSNQDHTLPDGSTWVFWDGTSKTMDPNKLYVVNVMEGGHILQNKNFDPGFQYPIKFINQRKIWKNRSIKNLQQKIDAIKGGLQNSLDSIPDENEKASFRALTNQLIKKYSDSIVVIDNTIKPLEDSINSKTKDFEKVRIELIRKELSANIRNIKALDPPVFMITISHLAYNGMFGHALALDGNGLSHSILKRFYRARVT